MDDDGTALLEDVRRMDAEALAKVFDLYAPAIYQYALRHCGNAVTADQIVGDVFAKLLEHLSQANGPSSSLRSYLFQIAYHCIVDEIRHARRVTPVEEMEVSLASPDATDMTVEKNLLFETILRAIQSDLAMEQRHVILVRFLEGFSLRETALIMGKKEGNIKVIQNRALAVLRRAIDHDRAGDGHPHRKKRRRGNRHARQRSRPARIVSSESAAGIDPAGTP
jgi:RNA polymerase sigma-70 factor, ECF subfamily